MGLQHAEAVQCASQRPRCLLRVVFTEAVSGNDSVDDVDNFSDRCDEVCVWGCRVAVGDRVQPGVDANKFSPRVGECHDGVVAGEADCGVAEVLGEQFPGEEAELVLDVVDAVNVLVES